MEKGKLIEITKGKTGTGLLVENDGYVSLSMPENKIIKESIQINENEGVRELPRPFVLNAIFQKYDTENANGRVYPEAILKREIDKYQEAIRDRRAYGECNHPESSSIDLGRIAMNTLELHWEGKTLVGKIEIPITEGFRKYGIASTCADMCAQWILSGLKIGLSSRGLGSVTQKGGLLYVMDDFELICFDVVSQPSTPGAYISEKEDDLQIYKEGKEDSKSSTIIKENKYSFLNKYDSWLGIDPNNLKN